MPVSGNNRCPECGAHNRVHARSCRQCGTPLAADWQRSRRMRNKVLRRTDFMAAARANQAATRRLVIILLLVGQFDSIRRPLIILLTIPLGLIGVFVGLTITQEPLGFMAFLGVIALSGIVINNAIVLLDRIKMEQDENGLTAQQAVLEATQRRLRPILLTTATTFLIICLWMLCF